jgi:hypothetical protein
MAEGKGPQQSGREARRMNTWDEVMAQLTGARLAALDALLRGGEMSVLRIAEKCERHTVPVIIEALQWLEAHYLVTTPAPGLFRAWSMASASAKYDRAGGPIAEFMPGRRNNQAAAGFGPAPLTAAAPAPSSVPANAAPSGVRVQDYQVQMFSDV